MNPSTTLTATPEVKARNGLDPPVASSRNRVVRPMLKKQKMKLQVLRSLMGATKPGLTVLLKSARPRSPEAAVAIRDATRKPSTNLGNRHQISAGLGRR